MDESKKQVLKDFLEEEGLEITIDELLLWSKHPGAVRLCIRIASASRTLNKGGPFSAVACIECRAYREHHVKCEVGKNLESLGLAVTWTTNQIYDPDS